MIKGFNSNEVKKLLIVIKQLNEDGLTDSAIARKLNKANSTINYYRNNVLNLPANQIKRSYLSKYDRLRGYIIRNVKFSAKRRNIEFNLNFTDFDLPIFCPILNIKLKYLGESSGNSFDHVTLDRIDNSKGYIKGNVIIISRLANAMKNEASFDQLDLFSKNMFALTNYYKNEGALGNITDIFPNIKLLEN